MFYESLEDSIVICDRYVTSNMLHQTSKLESREEKEEFLDWEYDFEYTKGGLPVPDKVFFLDVPPEVTFHLMEERENKITHGQKKDIHESSQEFLRRSYENSILVGERYGWIRIPCCDHKGGMKTIGEIHELIKKLV